MFAFQPDIFQLSVEANATITRSYAIEGQTFVVCSTQVIGQAAIDLFCDTEEHRKLLTKGNGWARIYGVATATPNSRQPTPTGADSGP